MIAEKIIVSGKVQGVFYRKFVYDNAIIHGLKGYVKNLDDGNVEIVAEGDKNNINKLIEECRKGPERAYVEEIKTSKIDVQSFESFNIRN